MKWMGLLFVALVATGCISMQQRIAQRASFELGCPVGEGDVQQLGSVLEYGVDRCGCRAVYVYGQAGILLNSISGDSCRVRPPASGGAAQ